LAARGRATRTDAVAQAGAQGMETRERSYLDRTGRADRVGVRHRRGRTRPVATGDLVSTDTPVTRRGIRPHRGPGPGASAFRAPDVDAGSRRQDHRADPDRSRG